MLVVAAGLLAYHNSLTSPFVYDDVGSIPENPTIRHLWPIWDALSPPKGGLTVESRPIINLSLAINYAFGGTKVWGYHAANLMIHILAGLTLLGVVRRTLQQPRLRERFGAAADGLALATTVIWTVHPLQTESVTYIIQRAEALVGLFYLLTLYCLIRAVDSPRPRAWYGLCVGACALGMASKEVMASAPLLVILYDRAFVSGSFREVWRRRWRLYLALASTWIVLGYLVFYTGDFRGAESLARCGNVTWWEYLLTEPGVILHYLQLVVWPHPLCFDYFGWPIAGEWTDILRPALVLVILLGTSVWACKSNSAWGFLGAWFFLILAPSSSVVPVDSPAYEHRMYLPLAALVALVTIGGFMLGKDLLDTQPQTRRMVEWGGSGALVLLLSILTIQRNYDYRSELVLWQDTAIKRPDNPRAQNALGLALSQAGRATESIAHFEQAVAIKPDYDKAHNNLGLVLAGLGRLPEAIGHYEQALRINPNNANAHNNLGIALAEVGRVEEAVEQFDLALQINPDLADVHNNLGHALILLGRAPEAIGHYEQGLRINPDYAEAHYNLGVALAQVGRVPEAMDHWTQAVRIKPDYVEAHYNLAVALEQAGRLQDAIGRYQQVLRIKPDFAEAQNGLARLRAVE
jgi:tetratricopeptide (TPR) repeat protein